MSEGAEAQAPAPAADCRVVVVGIDGSPNGDFAYKFYCSNVRKPGDKVYLVHSVELNSMLHNTQWYSSPYSFDREMLMKLLEQEKEKIRHKLEGFACLLKDSGVDGTVKSIHAESAGVGLCKAAEEVNAALVVVGCRGMGKLRRTFMGSVSDYVLHHSHVPVLVCRCDEHEHHHEKHEHHQKHEHEQKHAKEEHAKQK